MWHKPECAVKRSVLGKRTSSGMGVSKRLFVESSSSYVASMLRPQLKPHSLATSWCAHQQ